MRHFTVRFTWYVLSAVHATHSHATHNCARLQLAEQLNDLRRQQKSIFLIATNRLKSFDAAITRPGRIDLILFLGTPSLQSRLQRLDDALVTSGLKEADRSEARELTARFMDSAWESDLMFFNYRYHIVHFTFCSVALQCRHHSFVLFNKLVLWSYCTTTQINTGVPSYD
jgi:ATPase family associated with various cellular activities (AAA)